MCTRQLKTGPFFRWLAKQPDLDTVQIWLGMRAAESQDRNKNYGHLENGEVYDLEDISGECPKSCQKVKAVLPIVEITTPEVFQLLRNRGDKINPLYAKGHKRVGCFPCVLAGKGTMRLTARDPEGRANLARVGDAIKIVQWARPEMDVAAFFDHDVDLLLGKKEADPFGFNEDQDDAGGCSWCNL